MARHPIQPEGIPKTTTPSNGPATDPLDQRDGVPAAQPRPAAGVAAKPYPDWDAEEDDEPYGDPSTVKNEGPLKSLGKAVSSPVREAAESDPKDRGGPR